MVRRLVPMERIERSTSPLPRECSTTELHGRKKPIFPGAGEGNRTLVVSLEGFCSTIELHPRIEPEPERCSPQSETIPGSLSLDQWLVEGEGFEPSKAEPTDLQSVPFDRSGTPPTKRAMIAISVPMGKPSAKRFRNSLTAGGPRRGSAA